MYNLIFHPEAVKEYTAAISWYEEQQKDLGTRFIKLVDLTLSRIQKNPEHFRLSKKTYREAPIPIFPFTIIYKISKVNHTIYVASIFHTSRNPKLKFRKF